MQFHLRPWTEADNESLCQHANNPRIARFMTDSFPHPYGPANARAFLQFAQSHTPTAIFAIEVNGEAAGGIGLHAQTDILRRNMELGYWLGEVHWGKGIVTQAVKQMLRYGFSTFDIDRIYARPFGNNIPSQKVLEKAGFQLEARLHNTIVKNGELLDELIYAVRKKDLPADGL